jgi:hypothetical protein
MSKKLTTSEFKERLFNIYGNQFEVLSEYINNETKIKLKCNKCRNIIEKKPVKMTGSAREGCYICSGKYHKTTEYFKKELENKFPNQFEILEEYCGARIPINVRRLKCDHIQKITPDNLLRGKGCPYCGIRQSRYMDIVENYFDTHNIQYEKEKVFEGCRNIRPLPFDYYIESKNICVEVDGEFHYETNSVYLNNRSSYEEVHKRDLIKTQYCKDNNIKLIRLPYYDVDNFENILNLELHVNTEITQAS